jgi:hypothetical protein
MGQDHSSDTVTWQRRPQLPKTFAERPAKRHPDRPSKLKPPQIVADRLAIILRQFLEPVRLLSPRNVPGWVLGCPPPWAIGPMYHVWYKYQMPGSSTPQVSNGFPKQIQSIEWLGRDRPVKCV